MEGIEEKGNKKVLVDAPVRLPSGKLEEIHTRLNNVIAFGREITVKLQDDIIELESKDSAHNINVNREAKVLRRGLEQLTNALNEGSFFAASGITEATKTSEVEKELGTLVEAVNAAAQKAGMGEKDSTIYPEALKLNDLF